MNNQNKKSFIILAISGIILRIVPIWAMPLWYDEGFTLILARLPIHKMILATAGDVHPPLWYIICYPLAHIKNIPNWAAIRLPALLFGVLSIWVWYEILKKMNLTDKTKLISFVLFCLLPQQIYYSQEGRMYTLLTFLVLIAWLCILNKNWLGLGWAAACMLWLQNYGVFYIIALWVAAMIYDHKSWFKFTAAFAIAGIIYLPWFFMLLNQMKEIRGNYWILTFSIPSVLRDFLHGYFGTANLNADMVDFIAFYGVLLWAMIWSLINKKINIKIWVLSFLPVLIAVIISIIWQPIILYRALIPSGAFLTLIIAVPFDYLNNKASLLIAVVLIPALIANLAGIIIRPLWSGWLFLEGNSIQIIDKNWKPGDLLYYTDDGIYVTGSIIWENIDNALREKLCGMVYGALTPQTREAIGIVLSPIPNNYPGRIWIITTETPLEPECQTNYLTDSGLLNNPPLFCSHDDSMIKSCVYLWEGKK